MITHISPKLYRAVAAQNVFPSYFSSSARMAPTNFHVSPTASGKGDRALGEMLRAIIHVPSGALHGAKKAWDWKFCSSQGMTRVRRPRSRFKMKPMSAFHFPSSISTKCSFLLLKGLASRLRGNSNSVDGQKLDPKLHSTHNQCSNLQRQHLCTTLEGWRKTYDRFCSKANPEQKANRAWKQKSALILIQHAWLSVVLPTSYCEIEETSYDTYLHEFATITELASSILPEKESPATHFSLEFGLVPPLS